MIRLYHLIIARLTHYQLSAIKNSCYENESNVRTAVGNICDKLDDDKSAIALFGEL
jgi:hypothetical protein